MNDIIDNFENNICPYRVKSLEENQLTGNIIKIIYVNSFIKKVSMEEVAQMAVANKHKSVRYMDRRNKRFILNYTTRSKSKSLPNGTFVSKILILDVLYAKVEEYKKLLVYDHLKKNICYYVNDMGNIIRNSTTYLLAVWNYPSKLLNVIEDAILKNERSHFKVLN